MKVLKKKKQQKQTNKKDKAKQHQQQTKHPSHFPTIALQSYTGLSVTD